MLSVAQGIRRAARKTVSPAQLEKLAKEMAVLGLEVTPIVKVVPNRGGYRAKLEHAKGDEPFDISCVIARNGDAEMFAEASRAHDDDFIGELLGIPACCRAFFIEVWHRQKMIDTTWHMALNSLAFVDDPTVAHNSIITGGRPETNVLLRWLGIRLVPHLPCSFYCRESIRFARRLSEMAVQAGYIAGISNAWEMLSWPIEWSALHGIAEIRTPVFKLSVDTDATGGNYRVQLNGSRYPEDAERGLRFPYIQNEGNSGTHSLVQLRASDDVVKDGNDLLPRKARGHLTDAYEEHSENGFSSGQAMLTAHLNLLNNLDPILDRIDGNIIDLGCGNGELLCSLAAGKQKLTLYGVDRDEGKIARAKTKLGQTARLYTGNYLDQNGPWLGQQHALIIGTFGLLESEKRTAICLRVISCSAITVFHYYQGYGGNVAECLTRLEGIAGTIPDKMLSRIGERCWVVHDRHALVPHIYGKEKAIKV
jgi:2-polyprenyl-3-methyl-5-hydroxy-6-metoxy-1,4-benzoquinol methylase